MANGDDIVRQAAVLRAQGKFDDAIDLIERQLGALDDVSRIPGLLQAYYAAKQGGFSEKAKQLARLIAKEEPRLPSIQDDL